MLMNHDLAWRLARERHRELLGQAQLERGARMAKVKSTGKARSGRELITSLRRAQRSVRRLGSPAGRPGRASLRNFR